MPKLRGIVKAENFEIARHSEMLRPFDPADTAQYIITRLARGGMKDQTVFPADLMLEIHRRTQGIPRLINSVCDNLLLTAFAMESRVATLEMLDEVSNDLRLDWPGNPNYRARYQQEEPAYLRNR